MDDKDLSSWQPVERRRPEDSMIEMTGTSPRSPRDSLFSKADATPPTTPKSKSTADYHALLDDSPKMTKMEDDWLLVSKPTLGRSLSSPQLGSPDHRATEDLNADYVLVDDKHITIHQFGQEVSVLACSRLTCDGSCPPTCPFFEHNLQSEAERRFKRATKALAEVFEPDRSPNRSIFKGFVTTVGDLADEMYRTASQKLKDKLGVL